MYKIIMPRIWWNFLYNMYRLIIMLQITIYHYLDIGSFNKRWRKCEGKYIISDKKV